MYVNVTPKKTKMRHNTKLQLSLAYRKEIAKILQCEVSDIFLYRKGRVGLYVILQAIGLRTGDEVIISGYTCSAVINTIISLGAKPVYADILKGIYTIDLCQAKGLLTSKTKAIISQNTFGLSYGIQEINKWAHANHIYHIEDCAHGFSGSYHQIPNGRIGDAAFFSTHFSKPFNTGQGGIVVVNNKNIKSIILTINKSVREAPFSDRITIPIFYCRHGDSCLRIFSRLLLKVCKMIDNKTIYNQKSISSVELITIASKTQIKYGLNNIQFINKMNIIRKDCARFYSSYLKSHSKLFISDSLVDDHLFLYYPILVNDKQKVLRMAKENNIEVNGMFRVKKNSEEIGINYESLPITVYTSNHLINLPTNRVIDSKMEDFLNLIINEIL